MIVIGLTGYARAGKDTVADILVRDYGFEKRSFAGPLKKMLRTLDPFMTADWDYTPGYSCSEGCCANESVETIPVRLSELQGYTEDDLKESFGGEYRRLLQVLGTDCIRAIDPDFWVRAAHVELLEAQMGNPDARIVFTDCRFPNEAGLMLHFGVLGNVDRLGVNMEPGAHESEQHVGRMGEQFCILNDGTLRELEENVHALADDMWGIERVSAAAAA